MYTLNELYLYVLTNILQEVKNNKVTDTKHFSDISIFINISLVLLYFI